jgi:hypothetical protein
MWWTGATPFLQELLTLALNQLIQRVDLSHFVPAVSYNTTDQ